MSCPTPPAVHDTEPSVAGGQGLAMDTARRAALARSPCALHRTPPRVESSARVDADPYHRPVNRARVPLLTLALLATIGGAILRAAYVHEHTWQWALMPSAAAPKLEFAHRTYLRGTTRPDTPAGLVEQGRTMGGGTILALPPDRWVSTAVFVRSGDTITGYGLSGGP